MKRGLIFLNGDPPSEETLSAIDYGGAFIVCADGAYNYLARYAVPNVLIGDFDSISSVPSGVNVKRFPVDKDYTDGHLAVLELKGKVDEAEIYGAFGGRPDHEYANFALLALAMSIGIKAVLKGDYDVWFSDGELTVETEKNKTVSIVPYTDTAHIISTEGLKFPAGGMTLNKLHMIGVSNTATGEEVRLRLDGGSVLVFVQRR